MAWGGRVGVGAWGCVGKKKPRGTVPRGPVESVLLGDASRQCVDRVDDRRENHATRLGAFNSGHQ